MGTMFFFLSARELDWNRDVMGIQLGYNQLEMRPGSGSGKQHLVSRYGFQTGIIQNIGSYICDITDRS